MIVLPIAFEGPLMCTRKRFSASPYSLTSSLRDFPEVFLSLSLVFGVRKIFVRGISTRIPTARVTRPTGRKVKKDMSCTDSDTRPLDFALLRVSWMMRLGGVPIRVIIPPMLLAKANGMSRRLDEVPAYAAILTTIGSISATVPVLLTKPPIKAVTSITIRKSRVWLVPASFMTCPPIIFARPVWKIPPPTMKRPIIIITVVLEKPARPSDGVRI